MTAYLSGVARWTFASFWGVFDSMQAFWGQGERTPSPAGPLPGVYDILALLCAVCGLGLPRSLTQRPLTEPQKVTLTAFAVLILCAGLAHLRFVLVFFQAQGRYWYPALVPLVLFFILGGQGWLARPKARQAGLWVLVMALLALNVYTLCWLAGRFAGA